MEENLKVDDLVLLHVFITQTSTTVQNLHSSLISLFINSKPTLPISMQKFNFSLYFFCIYLNALVSSTAVELQISDDQVSFSYSYYFVDIVIYIKFHIEFKSPDSCVLKWVQQVMLSCKFIKYVRFCECKMLVF